MPAPLITLHKTIQKPMPVRVKDSDAKQGIVCAYASSFDVIDNNYPIPDVVCRGAFKKTINEQGPEGANRILYLWDHNPDMILGKPFLLREDDFGLYCESKIIRTSYGGDVLQLYEAGVINEHSIGYYVIDSSYGEKNGEKVRFLRQLALLEYSGVPWGMNSITPTMGLKGNPDAIKRLVTQLELVQSLLHSGHFQTDEVPQLLQKQSEEWRLVLKAVQPPEPAYESITTAHEFSTEEESVMTLEQIAALVRAEVERATKSASGSTSVPLGERTEAWSGSDAHNAVVKLATKDDGSIDQTIMKNAHFWYDESAPDKITSYKLIFCTVADDKLQAVWKGITGCAGALQGARGTGVDLPSGDEAAVKAKIEAWYKKAAKQYDDDTIVAPWVGEKGKRGGMRRKDFSYILSRGDYRTHLKQQLATRQKDFQGALAGQQEDLQQQWADGWDALACCLLRDMCEAVWGPLGGGDKPDVEELIGTDFDQAKAYFLDLAKKSVAADFVPCGDDDGDGFYNPDDDDDDDYGMMSAQTAALQLKEGKVISAANHKALSAAHAKIADGLKEAKSLMDKMKPSGAGKDEGEADTSDNSEDNENDAKGAKGAHPGAGASAHTTGEEPAGAGPQTTPANDEMTAAFNQTLSLFGQMRSLSGVDTNGNHR